MKIISAGTLRQKYIMIVILAVAGILLCVTSCATKETTATDAVSGPSPAAQAGSAITDAIKAVPDHGKVLVVYFTQGAATRTVAEDLAALTGADVEVIIEKKTRKGFFGFMGAGMNASFKTATPIEKPVYDPANYDTVFVCTPVWAWNLCPPVRTWLRMFNGSVRKAAFATVSGDTEPDKIVKAMSKESGVEPFAFVGFSESDFYPENRGTYIGKIAKLVQP